MAKNNNSIFFTEGSKVTQDSMQTQFAEHLEYDLAKDKNTVTSHDVLMALALSIRDRLVRNWIRTQHQYFQSNVKMVHYMSLEFLMGSLLEHSLSNLGLSEEINKLMKEFGYDIESIIKEEPDMGLGNGGLGRLAACFMESMATLEIPAHGYGIRYEFGIFEQDIENGYQIEKPDHWLRYGSPWEIVRPEKTYTIQFNGTVTAEWDATGRERFKWVNTDNVLAVAHDIPAPGYQNKTVNTLRLWQAKATDEFNLIDFNQGNYLAAVEGKNISETISKVLYPNDSIPSGKILRLRQQYFFVSATLQDIIKHFKLLNKDFKAFPDKNTVQLNDTHPAIAIPELMRALMDIEGLEWNDAWDITTKTFAYTNHTIVPEALEEWPESLMNTLLPRHMQIIEEINRRFIEEIKSKYSKDNGIIAGMSIIRENGGGDKSVRMAHLAIVGSHSINGVAELHTEILEKYLFKDFYKLYPEKFNNKTNGISIRRFLKEANSNLSELISASIGDEWIKDLGKIKKIEKFINDKGFKESWREIKKLNKIRLIDYLGSQINLQVNPDSMFDAQVKRFHEYKRQMLNVLHVITLYNRIRQNPKSDYVPRTVIFAGKAAPSYVMAKLTIKLINSVADIINNDKETGGKLKVLFIKNYGVSLAEKIIPASDLSEQISTAGFEASGTGNMKFALNGALTIGTLDGANIEIKNEVGDENIFIFGNTADQVLDIRTKGYNPGIFYENDAELKAVVDMIASNFFSANEKGIFDPIVYDLLHKDYYQVMADYRSYIETQKKVEAEYMDAENWTKKSIFNVARMEKFSSDRAIREYSKDIWKVQPMKITLK